MASLQNMLDVYFHMKNHYRKLKHVKSCVDTNNERKSAGRTKKQTPKSKQTLYSTLKDGKVRPPTRRNPKETYTTSDAHKPTCDKATRPFDKYKTNIQSPEDNSLVNIEEHEYLQFSLRMIEDIIKNNLFKREDLIRVFRQHYQANKHCLDHEKMVKTIVDWCCELNLNVDDNLLRYLNEPNDPNCQTEWGRRPKRVALRDQKHTLPTIHSSSLQTYTDEGPESTNSSVSASCDATSKQQPEISCDSHAVLVDPKREDFETVKPPPASKVIVDLSKTLDLSEATLKPIEGNADIGQRRKVGDSKNLEILHDAASRFIRDSDKESESSDALLSVSAASNEQTCIAACDKTTRKNEMRLVVTHYSISVEPQQIETKDICVQVVGVDSESEFVATSADDTTTVVTGCHLHDASTQKSTSDLSQSSSRDDTPTSQSKPTFSVEADSIESNKGHYVLLDYPVYISREHTEKKNAQKDVCNAEKGYLSSNLRMPSSDGSGLNQNVIYTMANNKIVTPNSHNNDYYDLTPQKDLISRVHQPQQEPPKQYYSPQPCDYRNVKSFNKAPMPGTQQQQTYVYNATPEGHDELNMHLLNGDGIHRLDRYQKVHDTLSCFYPTVATQVSSMDLVQDEPRMNFYQLREDHVGPYGGSQHRKQLPPRRYDPMLDRRSEYRMVLGSSDSLVNSNKSTSRSCASNYNTMPISSPVVTNQKDPKAKPINLDNYRIDVHARHADAKVPVDRDVETMRSSGPSRLMSPAKSPGRSASEDEVSGISLGAYPSNEVAKRRILNLRHDIQKYSKDNISSRRAPFETPRRIDVRNNSNVLLPAELVLSKQKRIPALRQH